MIVGPGMSLQYRTADAFNRRGTAEDILGAVGDDMGAARFVVILPEADAGVTAVVSQSFEFTRDDTRATVEAFREGHGAVVASLVVDAGMPGCADKH